METKQRLERLETLHEELCKFLLTSLKLHKATKEEYEDYWELRTKLQNEIVEFGRELGVWTVPTDI